jgi:putative membrane protein insertion efficiency factor
MTGTSVVREVLRVPRYVGLGLIRAYQLTISPLLGPRCKYYPSCSHYGYQAVERHGLIKGSVLAGWRILRCNPWSYGGVDDVPAVGESMFGRHASPAPTIRISATN